MEDATRFQRSLIHMLQTGTFQQMAECPAGRCAKVEFRLSTIYHVHLGRRHIVVNEHDVELIRRRHRGRWRGLRPTICRRRQVVLDRATGQILEAPGFGTRRRIVV